MALNIYSHDSHGRFTSNGQSQVITILGVEELQQRLREIQTTNPNFDRQLKKIISYVLRKANSNLKKRARSEMDNDPRQAYKAVRSAVYKRVFGGNVNIISRRKRSNFAASIPQQKIQTGRGGNRRKRSPNTERMMSYWGEDRGFILRWLNNGANRTNRSPNRGKIAGSHWFGNASVEELSSAADEMSKLIDRAIQELWNK